jgi:hypothetical protein
MQQRQSLWLPFFMPVKFVLIEQLMPQPKKANQ